MMQIAHGSHVYQVSERVAEAENYRLYLCLKRGMEHPCLLQIAIELTHNASLQRAAYILRELQRRAEDLEEKYARIKTDPNVMLNYQLGFPELMDSFVCLEQGGRQINILAFREVDNVRKVVPLVNLREKDHLRPDLRSSAWIMGKLLKMLDFAHSERIAVEPTGRNVLIVPDKHYVLIFDWSAAQIHSNAVPIETRRHQISLAAQTIITALGGDFQTGEFPNDDDPAFSGYTDHLLRLARGNESNTERAHTKFYELVDALWRREFYPFTTKSLRK